MKCVWSSLFVFLLCVDLTPAPLILPSWNCYSKCTATECCKAKVGYRSLSFDKKCVPYNKVGDSCDALPEDGYQGCGCEAGLICLSGKCAMKPEGWMPPTTTPAPTTPWPWNADKTISCGYLKGLENLSYRLKTLLNQHCKQ